MMNITSMKHIRLVKAGTILCLFLLAIAFQTATAQSSELTADEILDKVDDLYRGDSSQGTMTMTIKTEHWTRELTLEYWSLGKEKSLFRILAPKKEKGTATLKCDRDIWNYLPKVNRTIKLPSSMMSQSWMGSHFTNDDLVKESRFTDDYTFEKSFDGERDGQNIIEITCIPHEDAAVVWGKVIVIVEQDSFIPLEISYYDEDMELARTMRFSDVKDIGDRKLPVSMIVIPADKPDESTEVTYDEINFNVEIDEEFFSLRNLQDR